MLLCDVTVLDPRHHRHGLVTVRAPGRLHLGFLDPAGTLGRPFGSLGLVIEGFETAVTLSHAPADQVSAATPAGQALLGRARDCLDRLRERTGCKQPVHLRLLDALPSHAGFGSGTQLALAVGWAFARWHGLALDSATLARWLGRGLRSGIGVAGFDHGGLLLDGGPGAGGSVAPILSRLALPDAWRVVVVQDSSQQGLSGGRETQAIAALSPLPRSAAAEICHQVLMRVLPGAADADFPAFAAGVTRVQQVLGEHFAPAQGGSAYTSAAVGQLVQWIGEASSIMARGSDALLQGAAIGQSSWGPTGFAILPTQAAADGMVAAVRAAGLVRPGIDLRVVRARNHGGSVDVGDLDVPAAAIGR